MAIYTNTITSYDGHKSIREDLSDIIYNIAPVDCPLMSNIGKDKQAQPYTEWQTDSLASASTTGAVLEGDDSPSADTFVATNRVGNYAQINRKVISVSGTDLASKQAGIKNMLAYKLAQKAKELKRDMEATATSDQVAVVGNDTTARKTAALGSWIITNFYDVSTGTGAGGTAPTMSSGGSDGYPSTAAATGQTAATFTLTMLKTAIQNVWTQGGDIEGSFVMVGPHNKSVVSTFSGIATLYRDVQPGKQAQIIGAADVLVSDFGTVTIVPNRFQPENRAYIVDKDMLAISYLRSFKTVPLAQTGDATRRMLLVEWALKVKNEKGLGTIRGLATS